MGVSRREAARALGVSEGAVRKAISTGRIALLDDGTIDVEDARKRWGKSTDPARSKVRTGTRGAQGTQPLPPVTTEDDAKQAISLIRRVLESEGAASDGTVDFDMARTAETILKARERDLKIAERRKELVPLVKVKQHVEKAFIGYRQAVQRLPTRHAAAMAAELGCNAADLDRILSEAINAKLAALSAPVVRP